MANKNLKTKISKMNEEMSRFIDKDLKANKKAILITGILHLKSLSESLAKKNIEILKINSCSKSCQKAFHQEMIDTSSEIKPNLDMVPEGVDLLFNQPYEKLRQTLSNAIKVAQASAAPKKTDAPKKLSKTKKTDKKAAEPPKALPKSSPSVALSTPQSTPSQMPSLSISSTGTLPQPTSVEPLVFIPSMWPGLGICGTLFQYCASKLGFCSAPVESIKIQFPHTLAQNLHEAQLKHDSALSKLQRMGHADFKSVLGTLYGKTYLDAKQSHQVALETFLIAVLVGDVSAKIGRAYNSILTDFPEVASRVEQLEALRGSHLEESVFSREPAFKP